MNLDRKYSVVIPVYKNEASLNRLLDVITSINLQFGNNIEAVFVIDGSPDGCYAILKEKIMSLPYSCQLIAHSRNFGSFSAIRTGLSVARGHYIGVMAADLQEPPELLITFFRTLESDTCDVVIGTRVSRTDPFFSRLTSGIFWGLYRRLVVPDMPEGGVDIFGCNKNFRDHLIQMEESRSSLIALIFWLGFRRKLINYQRLERKEGVSSWTLKKKIDYMMDSIFAFTDFPIRVLVNLGMIGTFFSIFMAIAVLTVRILGNVHVPGYTATMLVVLIFGTMNIFALGVVGTYAWRGYENSKKRPLAVIAMKIENTPQTMDITCV